MKSLKNRVGHLKSICAIDAVVPKDRKTFSRSKSKHTKAGVPLVTTFQPAIKNLPILHTYLKSICAIDGVVTKDSKTFCNTKRKFKKIRVQLVTNFHPAIKNLPILYTHVK